MDKNQILCNEIVKDHSIEKISYEERKNRRKDFDYSKLYEFFDVEDLNCENILLLWI